MSRLARPYRGQPLLLTAIFELGQVGAELISEARDPEWLVDENAPTHAPWQPVVSAVTSSA